jgi:hypothetical protein
VMSSGEVVRVALSPQELEDRATISVEEWAAIFNVSRKTAYALAGKGAIPGLLRIGERRWRISAPVTLRTLQEGAVPA